MIRHTHDLFWPHSVLKMAMDRRLWVMTVSIGIVAGTIGLQPLATAQILPDGTLSTTVTSSDNFNFLIEGGHTSGPHLFHSFEEFSIPTSGSAQFNNATDIETIFSRVTGSTISDIDGLIQTNDTANLFLLNPNGIVFGKNASLNIGGSFFATTAESIVFDDGVYFSAVEPDTDIPLLSINVMPGLQMGQRSGAITIQGNGHQLTGGFLFPTFLNDTAKGLQVGQGQTLGFVAPDITLTGGILRTSDANVSIYGIEEGILALEEVEAIWQMDGDNIERFGSISLTEQSLVDTSGLIPGRIQLHGRNIRLDDGSVVMIQNFGTQPSEPIIVKATQSLDIEQSIRNAPDQDNPLGNITGVISSRLLTETLGAGQGGDLIVSSQNLALSGGGQIIAYSYGTGNSGSVTVSTDHLLRIEGYSFRNPDLASGIATIGADVGRAGDLWVDGKNVMLSDGGILVSFSFGNGEGGDVNLTVVEDLTMNGFNPDVAVPSQVGSSTFGTGTGGDVVVDAARISLDNGADIVTLAGASASAGHITVNTTEFISITSETQGTNGVSSIFSGGTILAPELLRILGLTELPSGDSGNVNVQTPRLRVRGNSIVSVGNEGLGDSGDLYIQSNQIIASDGARISGFSRSGQGGNVNIDVQEYLLLHSMGRVQADTAGQNTIRQSSVDGGNITLRSPLIVGVDDSDILANAVEGNGGNISIETQALFGLEFRDRLTSGNDITASSKFGIDGTVEISNLDVDPSSQILELPDTLVDISQLVRPGCSLNGDQFVLAGRGGIPPNPLALVDRDRLWTDNRDLSAFLALSVSARSLSRRVNVSEPTSIQEATEMAIASNGALQLVALNSQNTMTSHPTCTVLPKNFEEAPS